MSDSQKHHEDGCFATTFERKYYHRGGAFIKRTLRPKEFRTGFRGLHIPRLRKETLRNEAECLRYIREHTDVPVPTVYCDFEDDDAYYLITEYIDGVSMSELSEEQKIVVGHEIERHLAKLQNLKSKQLGGPTGIVIPPYRVLKASTTDHWRIPVANNEDYLFCHNDLSQQNVIVDPDTLTIKAIIDWEYSGFYPARFERAFYKRLGPSVAVDGEEDDAAELLEFLNALAHDNLGNSSRLDGRSLTGDDKKTQDTAK